MTVFGPNRTRWLALVLVGAGLGVPQSARSEDSPAAPPAAPAIDVGAPECLEVVPTEIRLETPRREGHLVVTGIYAAGRVQDLTAVAAISSSNPAVAQVVGNRVTPVADGTAQVVIEVGGRRAEVPVTVSGQSTPEAVSYVYGALVALTKQGCNQGACHGSPSGKGGFRLSLRAYDPVFDLETLVRESYNRRTNVQEPEASLLLRKPLMDVAHGGGRRLTTDDPAYALLRDWIAEGLKPDAADAARCVKLEIFPRQRVLVHPAVTQQLVAWAHFSDGSIRDVTRLASYSSSDEAVATVDAGGRVTAAERGETAVLVRFLEHMETAYLTFLKPNPEFVWSNPQPANFIDEAVYAKLRELEINPSEVASDDEFLRRAYLDVIGELPSLDETLAFLADTAPDKRARLVDALVERPEYAEFWGLKWADLLRVNNKNLTQTGVHKFRRWIVAALRDNVPYDQFVSRLLTATGSTFDNPPANYFRAAADTNDCTETTAQLFLGIRIQCAKCHNHPFERWTQDNYYGIGAFFNRLQRKPGPRAEELVVAVARGGEVTQPRTGRQMNPWLPLSGEAALPGEDDRRATLVAWLVRPDNPFFAQAHVNRVWGQLLGRGIVEPVDDFRASNPPSIKPLLDQLAADFVTHGYDQKQLLRTILKSHTYQASARANETNRQDTKYFSHAKTRLLTAEQLLDAICLVTGVAEKYAGLPPGTPATQLPSPDVGNYFLKVFGQPAREMACQCERSSESNLSQALQMINGPLVHDKLRAEGNRLRQLASAGQSDDEIVKTLYLAAFCRVPNEAELAAAKTHIAAQTDRLQALEDVCWAILNAKEFLFQH